MSLRSSFSLCILCVASILVIAGCGETTDPIAPDTSNTLAATKSACTPMEFLCAQIVTELNIACPINAEYRNYGQHRSCEAHIINKALAGYESCYNDSQLREVRDCIAWTREQQLRTHHKQQRKMD